MTAILWIGIIFLMILSMWAQMKVKGNFTKYSKVRASCGMTGAQAAHVMLERAGVHGIGIERAQGFLSDHYDSRKKVIRLSPGVHDSESVAALGVACHEAGHAIQDARNYAPLMIRNLAVPVAGFGSQFGLGMVFLGLILGLSGLAIVGLILFACVVVFEIVNLPVEFDATARAKKALVAQGMVQPGAEAKGVDKVLNAAAMTYVAATLTSVFYLLYYAMLIFGRRN